MRHITLKALTWGTVTAAVSSALWLAASEPSWPDSRKLKAAPPMLRPQREQGATGTSRSGTEASPGEPQRGEPLAR